MGEEALALGVTGIAGSLPQAGGWRGRLRPEDWRIPPRRHFLVREERSVRKLTFGRLVQQPSSPVPSAFLWLAVRVSGRPRLNRHLQMPLKWKTDQHRQIREPGDTRDKADGSVGKLRGSAAGRMVHPELREESVRGAPGDREAQVNRGWGQNVDGGMKEQAEEICQRTEREGVGNLDYRCRISQNLAQGGPGRKSNRRWRERSYQRNNARPSPRTEGFESLGWKSGPLTNGTVALKKAQTKV